MYFIKDKKQVHGVECHKCGKERPCHKTDDGLLCFKCLAKKFSKCYERKINEKRFSTYPGKH